MRFTQRKIIALATTALTMAASMPAVAQDADGAGAGDIIVTARRTEERLQDVPISITVMNQQQLSERNIVGAQDLARYTPSLSTNDNFGGDNATFAIRGFVQDIGTAPSVGVYFADVVAPRGGGVGIPFGDGASAGSFFDLQNVQVLKGPQGTLQGRNTTGGSVMFVPQKPTRDLEGYVEGSIGNYDMQRLQGVINVPFGDSFRMRLGVDRMTRDGYMKNHSGVGPKDFNGTNYTAVRASFVADLTPELENYTIVSFTNSNTNGTAQKVLGVGPGLGHPSVDLNPFNLLAYNQLQRVQGLGFYDIEQDMANPKSHVKQWQAINTTIWQASDTLTVKNIASYAQYTHKINSPLFSTNFISAGMAGYAALYYGAINAQMGGSFPNFSTADSLFNISGFANSQNGIPVGMYSLSSAAGIKSANQSTFTEELQFQGHSGDNRLKWQAGAYFESSKPLGLVGQQTKIAGNCSDLANYVCSDPYGAVMSYVNDVFNQFLIAGDHDPMLPPGTVAAANYTVARNSYRDIGLYAQASYEITDQLTATGGFRYTWDRQTTYARLITHNYVTNNYDYGALGVWGLPMYQMGPFAGTVPLPLQDNTDKCTLLTTDHGGVYDPVTCSANLKQTSKAPTWMIDLEYKPVNDVMLYAKYSRGYRAGGIKQDGPLALLYFKPEKVDTFEAGAKTSFRGAVSGVFNVTGFYNKFSDQQLMLGLNADSHSGLSPTSSPYNAGKSRMWGIEADTTLNLFSGFTVNAGYTYLNTKIQKITLPDASDLLPYILSNNIQKGDELVLSPKHKLTVSAAYTLPLDEKIGKITLGATLTHTGAQRSNYADREFMTNGVWVNGPNGLVLSHDDLGWLPSTDVVDLNVNWNSVGGKPLDLSFFMTNVTGEKYITYTPGLLQHSHLDSTAPYTASGVEAGNVAPPRMYGMRAKVHF